MYHQVPMPLYILESQKCPLAQKKRQIIRSSSFLVKYKIYILTNN
jgi:hypothetical protein